jgi:hypothetical protein
MALRLSYAELLVVITKLSTSGINTGPPQLREYPVEPVGVEIINPSAQYVVKYSSLNTFLW